MYLSNYRNWLKLACFGALALSSVFAGDEVMLRFVSFPKNAHPAELELLIGTNQTLRIEVPTNRISKAYKVPQLEKWTIGTSDYNGAEFTFNSRGETRSLDSKRQLILILCRGEEESEVIQLIPIDTSAKGFSGGCHLLVNNSPGLISGVLGSLDFSLQDGQHAILAPEASPSSTSAPKSTAAISIYNENNKRPFFSSSWRINQKARSIVIIHHDLKTRQLKLHSIRDYLNP